MLAFMGVTSVIAGAVLILLLLLFGLDFFGLLDDNSDSDSPAAVVAASPTPTPTPAPAPLTGTRSVRVYNINSSCGPEAEYTRTVEIVQDGSVLDVVGMGNPGAQWNGSVAGSDVEFHGDRAEGLGTTHVRIEFHIDMTADPWTLFDGKEIWTHTVCSGGSSLVDATRLS